MTVKRYDSLKIYQYKYISGNLNMYLSLYTGLLGKFLQSQE